MAVERVDYYSDAEYEQALQAEQEYYQSQPQEPQEPQEPEVVPCYKCGGQMYEEGPNPEDNVCQLCVEQSQKGAEECET